ncbi:MAG: hypothetical protein INR63_17450 [Actinomycetospora chiangmaiensis]|nr:hypothetical protein [Actinomycetospora chiangmaiensis]
MRIVAFLALYALALQGVLGGAAMAVAAPQHVLCLAGLDPDGAAPAGKHLPAQGHAACCVTCHVASPAALPAPPPIAGAPIAHPVSTRGPRMQRVALPRAPPRRNLGARAPPVA